MPQNQKWPKIKCPKIKKSKIKKFYIFSESLATFWQKMFFYFNHPKIKGQFLILKTYKCKSKSLHNPLLNVGEIKGWKLAKGYFFKLIVGPFSKVKNNFWRHIQKWCIKLFYPIKWLRNCHLKSPERNATDGVHMEEL